MAKPFTLNINQLYINFGLHLSYVTLKQHSSGSYHMYAVDNETLCIDKERCKLVKHEDEYVLLHNSNNEIFKLSHNEWATIK